jgi:hypothetical protein
MRKRRVGIKYVYFARRGSRGPIKIGCSFNVALRMKDLNTRLLGAVLCSRISERDMHKKFAHLHVPGWSMELFRPASDLLHYIREEAQNHSLGLEVVPAFQYGWSKPILKRMDRIAKHMSKKNHHVSRAHLLRIVAETGLEKLESSLEAQR